MGSGSSTELPQRLTFDFKESIETKNSASDYINRLYYASPIDHDISNGSSFLLDNKKFSKDPKCALTYNLHRKNYLSNKESCCLNNILSDNNDYCNPDGDSIYTNDYCDNIIKSHCLTENKEVCYQWIETYLTRKDDEEFINDLSAECILDYSSSKCKALLIALKKINIPKYNTINNNIINSKNNKRLNLCLNPPSNIIREDKKKNISLDCWYHGCTNLEYWQLTTDQLDARKKCNVTFCSITLGDLNIDSNSTISIECNSGTTSTSSNNNFDSIFFRNEQYKTLMNIPDIQYLIILVLIFLFFIFKN